MQAQIIGNLVLALVTVVTPWKLANATNQGLPLHVQCYLEPIY